MSDDSREKRADTLYNHAHQLCLEDRHAEAADIYLTLLREYADLFHEWNLNQRFGVCLRRSGKTSEAVRYLRKAYQTIPKESEGLSYMQALDCLAEAHFHLDEYEAARECAEEGEKFLHHYTEPQWSADRFNFCLLKGRIYLYLREFNNALKELRRLRDVVPVDGDMLQYNTLIDYEIGRTYYYSGDLEAAFTLLDKLDPAQLGPAHHFHYHFVVEKLHVKMKAYLQALEHFETLKQTGIPEHWTAEVYNFAGRAYYYLGDGANARKCFEESKKHPAEEEWIEESNNAFLEELRKAGH